MITKETEAGTLSRETKAYMSFVVMRSFDLDGHWQEYYDYYKALPTASLRRWYKWKLRETEAGT